MRNEIYVNTLFVKCAQLYSMLLALWQIKNNHTQNSNPITISERLLLPTRSYNNKQKNNEIFNFTCLDCICSLALHRVHNFQHSCLHTRLLQSEFIYFFHEIIKKVFTFRIIATQLDASV
jgi:hypothetical protein